MFGNLGLYHPPLPSLRTIKPHGSFAKEPEPTTTRQPWTDRRTGILIIPPITGIKIAIPILAVSQVQDGKKHRQECLLPIILMSTPHLLMLFLTIPRTTPYWLKSMPPMDHTAILYNHHHHHQAPREVEKTKPWWNWDRACLLDCEEPTRRGNALRTIFMFLWFAMPAQWNYVAFKMPPMFSAQAAGLSVQ